MFFLCSNKHITDIHTSGEPLLQFKFALHCHDNKYHYIPLSMTLDSPYWASPWLLQFATGPTPSKCIIGTASWSNMIPQEHLSREAKCLSAGWSRGPRVNLLRIVLIRQGSTSRIFFILTCCSWCHGIPSLPRVHSSMSPRIAWYPSMVSS